jgi:hypothetical protein
MGVSIGKVIHINDKFYINNIFYRTEGVLETLSGYRMPMKLSTGIGQISTDGLTSSHRGN